MHTISKWKKYNNFIKKKKKRKFSIFNRKNNSYAPILSYLLYEDVTRPLAIINDFYV